MRWHLATLAGLWTVCFAADARAAQHPSLEASVDSLFHRWNDATSPGCAVGIDVRGEVVLRAGYGLADIEHSVAWNSDIPGYIGSASKQFQAFTVLLLADRARLSLEDDLRGHVPELHDFGHRIALRQLLHHTSGMRDFPSLMYYAGFGEHRPYGDEDIWDMLLRQRSLLFMPGTDVAYSTTGYWLLALIVERVTGMPWAEFAQAEIFGPLNMSHTFEQADLEALVPERSLGYERIAEGRFRLYDREFTHKGSLFVSVNDLLKWAANFTHARVGGRTVVDAMGTPGTLTDGDTIPEAAGLVVEEYAGHRLYAHNGRNKGHSAELLRFPDSEIAVAVLCNVRDASAPRLARRVADLVLPPSHAASFERTEAPEDPRGDDAATGPEFWRPADLADVLGDYVRGTNVFKVTATASSATLDHIEIRFNDEDDVYGISETRGGVFQLTGPTSDGTETIEFRRAETAVTLIYHAGPGSSFEFQRIEAPSAADLAAVGGIFHSVELAATYVVTLVEGRLWVRLQSPLASRVFPGGLFHLGGLQWTDGSGTRIAFHEAADGTTVMTISDARAGDLAFSRVGAAHPDTAGSGRAQTTMRSPVDVMVTFLEAFVDGDYDTCRSLLLPEATITITRRMQGGGYESQHLAASAWLDQVGQTGVHEIEDFTAHVLETMALEHEHGATATVRFRATGNTGRGVFANNGFDTGSLIRTAEGWRILHYSSFEDFSWKANPSGR